LTQTAGACFSLQHWLIALYMSDFLGLIKIWFGTLPYQAYDIGECGGGHSPTLQLVVAAKYGDLNNFKILYNQRLVGGLNYSHPSDGVTPLIAASQNGHLHVVEYLIKRNAAVDMPDASGETALLKAIRAGQLEVVKYLLKEGKSNAKIRNYQGDTALSIAVFYHQVGIVEVLLDQPEPWNVRLCNPRRKSESPLSLARELKYKDIEATLLEYNRRQQQALRDKQQVVFDEKSVKATSPTFAAGDI
jgi:hypothetical protein